MRAVSRYRKSNEQFTNFIKIYHGFFTAVGHWFKINNFILLVWLPAKAREVCISSYITHIIELSTLYAIFQWKAIFFKANDILLSPYETLYNK